MAMKKKGVKLVLKILLAFVMMGSHFGYVYAVESNFDAGILHFKKGEYSRAIEKFQQAIQQEGSDARLHYNLAVSHYKLAQYNKAKDYFLKAASTPSFEALSYYNLGLIAFRLDGAKSAANWFQRSQRAALNPQIKRLAEKQIEKLKTGNAGAKRGKKWSGFVSVRLANSDNATRLNDDISLEEPENDNYINLLGFVTYRLDGTRKRGNAIKMGGGSTRYNRISEYNSDRLNIGYYHSRPLFGWSSLFGLHYYYTRLEGIEFQQKGNFRVRFDKKYTTSQRLRLQYDYYLIDSLDPAYDHLNGTRQRIRIENRTRTDFGLLRVGYVLEHNDRKDLTQVDQQEKISFTSSSPLRQTVFFSLRYPFTNKWSSQLDLSLRSSRYSDATIDSNVDLGKREDKRVRSSIKVIYALDKRLTVETAYRYTSNESNFSSKKYSVNVLSVNINKLF